MDAACIGRAWSGSVGLAQSANQTEPRYTSFLQTFYIGLYSYLGHFWPTESFICPQGYCNRHNIFPFILSLNILNFRRHNYFNFSSTPFPLSRHSNMLAALFRADIPYFGRPPLFTRMRLPRPRLELHYMADITKPTQVSCGTAIFLPFIC